MTLTVALVSIRLFCVRSASFRTSSATTANLNTGAFTFNANSSYRFEMNNATGTAGELAYDASYFYVCTSTNTWMRILGQGGY